MAQARVVVFTGVGDSLDGGGPHAPSLQRHRRSEVLASGVVALQAKEYPAAGLSKSALLS